MLNAKGVVQARKRIDPFIKHTPILISDDLNKRLGADIFFKFEGFQTTGSFKLRGALNALLTLKAKGVLPGHVVAFSSGNHAQAVAFACKTLGIKSTIFIAESSSEFKIKATRAYGAEVVLTKTKMESEERALQMQKEGSYFLHPFDNNDVILGQGTCCYEALLDGIKPEVIVAPVGGGGLISGTYLAASLLSPSSKLIGGEPKLGNDAMRSLIKGEIFRWHDTPNTIADGARTLAVSERTFEYIKRLDEIIDVEEDEIVYWTRMLFFHLKITAEPTSAVAMAALHKWLQSNNSRSKRSVLIILSGGNIDGSTYKKIWDTV